MTLVEVKPIETGKWHGKTGKDAFARPVTIEALVSSKTGQYATGLNLEDRKRLEKETGFDLSSEYIQGKAHIFWGSPTAHVKLENKTNIFNTKKAIDEIKVKILKASDLVANSMKEYEEGLFPFARFVIFDEFAETEAKATKIDLQNKLTFEIANLAKNRKIELLQILSGINVKNQSDNYITVKLDELLKREKAETVLFLITKDKLKTSIHAMILEAIQKGFLRKDGAAILYMADQVGFDMEDAIKYFSDSKNQSLKAQILEKINS